MEIVVRPDSAVLQGDSPGQVGCEREL
jgi:hypothetical protein